MGFLKKLTKPISKFLDKIVPNEIKPALPYLSAFAPFMMGPTGIMGSSMLRRALMSGALNLGSQLAQEGSEGEFNPLSVLLAGSTGAMTSPDAPGFFKGMQREVPYKDIMTDTVISPTPDTGIMASIKHGIGKGGETASNWLQTQGDILRPGGEELTMKNALTAASVPATTGTADLAMADARRALRDYENEMAGAPDAITGGVTDEGRRRAIRAALEAGGHAEETILDALASLGLDLRGGGIVGLKHGGRIGYQWGGGNWGPGGKSPSKSSSSGGGGWSPGVGRSKKGYLGGHPGGGTGTNTTWSPSVGRTPTGYLSGPTGLRDRDNPLMAGLTKKQMMLLDQRKNMLDVLGVQGLLDTITSEDDPDDPATQQNVIDYYGGTYVGAQGGRVGLLRGGDPNDYPQQEDVSILELQKEEGVPIGPMAGMGSVMKLFQTPYGFDRSGFEEMIINFQEDNKGMGLHDFAIQWLDMVKKDTPDAPVQMAAQGGMMSVLPKGKEMDYRGGGVIPVGSRERADDVPARLSKNEFVMTADAVRAAGGGSVNRGAKKMYNLMHNLEARV
jgi:hypothetical protein